MKPMLACCLNDECVQESIAMASAVDPRLEHASTITTC